MISFATEFPLSTGATATQVLREACEWITGSPHSALLSSQFDPLPENDELEVASGSERATLASISTDARRIAGARYHRIADGIAWTSTVVGLEDGFGTRVSVTVGCEAIGTAIRLPIAKPPRIIGQILGALGGGLDGNLKVSPSPIRLEEDHAAFAVTLINGEARNRLPLVYLSRGDDGALMLDPDVMALRLAGMAHVIVEPSRAFGMRLRHMVDGRNVYGGTIGVFWPNSGYRNTYYPNRFEGDINALREAIHTDVRTALTNRRLTSDCTWGHLREELARFRSDRLKEASKATELAYCTTFDAERAAKDDELTAKEARLADALQEIARLQAETELLASRQVSAGAALLHRGHEVDHYPDEVHDIVVSAIRAGLSSVRAGSREEHVLNDIIAANPPREGADAIKAELKALFRDYRSMDARIESALVRMGFSLSSEGKHIKIVFRNDPRYTFALPKSGSDRRGGRNIAAEIIGRLF